jgi:hypothetical protein
VMRNGGDNIGHGCYSQYKKKRRPRPPLIQIRYVTYIEVFSFDALAILTLITWMLLLSA